jgi:hypothetical protein
VGTTVTVRSRSGRTVPAAGVAWGPTWRTIDLVHQSTVADLFANRKALEIKWPAGLRLPDGSIVPDAPVVAMPVALPADVQAMLDTIGAPPGVPGPAADPPPAPEAASPPAGPPEAPVAPPQAIPEAPAQPVPPAAPVAPPPARQAPVPVATATYTDTKVADGMLALTGMFASVMQARGIKSAAPPEDADLGPGLTLEALLDELTAVTGTSPLSAVQRALVRMTDGRPTMGVLAPQVMNEHTGSFVDAPGVGQPPAKVYLRCGVRCGKTYISAIGLVKCALTCSTRRKPTAEDIAAGRHVDADGTVSLLQPGEAIEVKFCTPKAEQSGKAFVYVKSAFKNHPRLAKYVIKDQATCLRIRRPCDGVEVEFTMVAASPQGNNMRSGWLAGAMCDESAFFDDGDESAITLRDNVMAAAGRLLPGGQVWMPSSPWADDGYWHEHTEDTLKAQAHGAWSADAVAFKAGSYAMNPALDPNLRRVAMAENPSDALREYDAVPVTSLSNQFFPPAALALAVNENRTEASGTLLLPPIAGIPHYAGTDLGFTRNSSTLAIARNVSMMRPGGLTDVSQLAYHNEWIPPAGRPLVPREVVHAFGADCQRYGALAMRGDNAYTPGANEHLATLPGKPVAYSVWQPTMERNTEMFTRARELMAAGRVELPNDPRLLGQLKRVLGKALPGGRYQILLPKQGRSHGDLVVAVVHAIVQAADQATMQLDYDSKYDAALLVNDRGGTTRDWEREADD